MKKILLIMILLIACTQVQENTETPNITTQTQIIPINETVSIEIPSKPPLNDNIYKYIVRQINNFTLTKTDAEYDNFGIIQAERYDARYESDITVIVHVFKFTTKDEMNFVINTEFYDIINQGMTRRVKNTIATYLSEENHRIAVWTNNNTIIFIDTTIPDFVERQIVDAYLERYPSDLKNDQCIDTDRNDHLTKGTTTRVMIDSEEMEWTDVCLRDFEQYKNKQYTPKISQSQDTVLEGRCVNNLNHPGYIEEYVCPRGCEDGKCK